MLFLDMSHRETHATERQADFSLHNYDIIVRLSATASCIMRIVPHEQCVNYSLLRRQLKVWQEISPSSGVLEETEGALMTSPAVCLSLRLAGLLLRGVGVTRGERKTHYSLQSRNTLKMMKDHTSQKVLG